jgi:hypothetical protein
VCRDADENGHYQFAIGENLAPRFKIMRKFGEGTFGQVLECWDRKRKDYVAVKIIRNIEVGSCCMLVSREGHAARYVGCSKLLLGTGAVDLALPACLCVMLLHVSCD